MGQFFSSPTATTISTYAKTSLENAGLVSKYDIQYEARTHEEIQEKLEKYGICYVPDVLDDKERFDMISGTWDYFEHVTANQLIPISRSEPTTWTTFDIFFAGLGMMYNSWNVGHAQHLWDIRQNKKIIDIFVDLFDMHSYKNLLVSFDGMAFLLPPEETQHNWRKERDCNLHLDQRLCVTKRAGFQSFVTANDIEEGDATIQFLEGSHKYIKDFTDEFGEFTGGDWVVFQKDHLKFYREKCSEVFLKCPAKSLVLWDSRLVHCGANPKRLRKNANTRCIAYISYAPKNLATNADISIKKQALEQMMTSNHYANRASYFPTHPHGEDDSIKIINAPKLSKIGYSLVGYNTNEIQDIFD
jgi:ectoine hydroxylase-related dioxygenase (phytanoyl-CoA dioxygenase family)